MKLKGKIYSQFDLKILGRNMASTTTNHNKLIASYLHVLTILPATSTEHSNMASVSCNQASRRVTNSNNIIRRKNQHKIMKCTI